jgi:hypothetical protein
MHIESCAGCKREFNPGTVLIGWHPCQCGGHAYAFCRVDKGGCGETTYKPPMNPDTCRDAPVGFSGR